MLFTHCQKRDFGAKNRSVLSKILIGFCGNPLELGKIGGDSRTRIFTAFSIQRGAESLETRRFSGYCTFSYLPSNSARFGFHHLTRNQFDGNVTWVRIPSSPPTEPLKTQCFQGFFLFGKNSLTLIFCFSDAFCAAFMLFFCREY